MPPNFNLNDYVDVQTRINDFWAKYPDGAITTTIEALTDDQKLVIVKAAIYKQRPSGYEAPDATGYAQEIAGTSNVNKDSHVENAETSAIGRALANLGFAKDGKTRASRQEMEKVARRQAARETAQPVESNPPALFSDVVPSGEFKGRLLNSLDLAEAKRLWQAIPAANAWKQKAADYLKSKLPIEQAEALFGPLELAGVGAGS